MQLPPMTWEYPKGFEELFQRAAEARKPIALWLAGFESGRHETLEWLEEANVVVFPSPEKAIRALSVLYSLNHSVSESEP